MSEVKYLTEVPSSLKQLARLVVRGFYTIEDALIIDMLVRNPCMKEDDLCELLRFDKKQMRARIATLRSDKFIQVRLKMETGPDGKAQKVNYYFINYKTFVNVVKYKLDLMRKRMETEERDATSRASFKCTRCTKTFTDLEVDQLFDFNTQEFNCTYCGSTVEEDSLAMPKKDSRLMLAKFNEQLQPLYDLLREVENVTLAPELLEPEPVDIDMIRSAVSSNMLRPDAMTWSGDATRNQGFAAEETRININIHGDDDQANEPSERKARPVWMTESTVITEEHTNIADDSTTNDGTQTTKSNASNANAAVTSSSGGNTNSTPNNSSNNANSNNTTSGTSNTNSSNRSKKENEDIMLVLLQHEKQTTDQKNETLTKSIKAQPFANGDTSDSSDDDQDIDNMKIPNANDNYIVSESDDDDTDFPTVRVLGRPFAINQVDDDLIVQMTPQEKEHYIHVYQHHFSHIYD